VASTYNLYAVSANGDPQWVTPFQGLGNTSDVVVAADGALFYHNNDYAGNHGQLIAVNSDGTPRWTANLATGAYGDRPLVGTDGQVYVGANSFLLGFDQVTGAPGVSKLVPIGFATSFLPIAAKDGAVLAGAFNGVYELLPVPEAQTATVLWSYTGGFFGVPVGSQVDRGAYVEVSNGGASTVAISTTGQNRFNAAAGDTPGVASDDTLFIPDGDKLHAVSSAGAPLWTWNGPAGSQIYASPPSDAGFVYAATSDGKIYKIAR
jgi:hypothetical protein